MANNPTQYDCIVIGGGASGLMAAGRAAERGNNVLLLEKNQHLGEKLSTTGGGRCNITNAERDTHQLLSEYGAAEKFLYSPFSQFGVADTFEFFSARGLPLIVQEEKRAFPETENADDVVAVMTDYVRENSVTVKTGIEVEKLLTEDDRVIGAATDRGEFHAQNLILATGSYARTTSKRDNSGQAFLSTLGHTVKEPSPNIVPLAVADNWVRKLSGTSLEPMRISFFLDGERQFSKVGELLFTHFGISGPLILNSAKRVNDLLQSGPVTATIDVFPRTDRGELDEQVLEIFREHKNKQLKNVLPKLTPESIGKVLGPLLEIAGDRRINTITTDERREIIELLKALPLSISGLMGFDRAVIADGGVTLEEVDTATMRSTLFENLYLTGDILDINRPSGGYSLQLAWTTGFVAGSSTK